LSVKGEKGFKKLKRESEADSLQQKKKETCSTGEGKKKIKFKTYG